MVNPGKLIQKFFRNFSFPGHRQDRITGKLIHFYEISILGLCHNRYELNCFTGKLIQTWMSLSHAQEFVKYNFSTKCFILEWFSRNRPISCGITHAQKFLNWRLDKYSSNTIWLMTDSSMFDGWVFQKMFRFVPISNQTLIQFFQ